MENLIEWTTSYVAVASLIFAIQIWVRTERLEAISVKLDNPDYLKVSRREQQIEAQAVSSAEGAEGEHKDLNELENSIINDRIQMASNHDYYSFRQYEKRSVVGNIIVSDRLFRISIVVTFIIFPLLFLISKINKIFEVINPESAASPENDSMSPIEGIVYHFSRYYNEEFLVAETLFGIYLFGSYST